MLTAERARELLTYDPLTGLFAWKQQPKARRTANPRAGTVNAAGYRQIKIDGEIHYEHRLAFLIANGAWPADMVDHVNGVTDDNRMMNLRVCDRGQLDNMQNRSAASVSSSGHVGVHWNRTKKRWRAEIMFDGRRKHLGYFDDKDQAIAAYLEAKAAMHSFQPTPRTEANAAQP